MLKEKYNLNEQSLNFVIEIEKNTEQGRIYTNKELVKLFEASTFYNSVIRHYYKTAAQKSIWWAVKRSCGWKMQRGKYTKI